MVKRAINRHIEKNEENLKCKNRFVKYYVVYEPNYACDCERLWPTCILHEHALVHWLNISMNGMETDNRLMESVRKHNVKAVPIHY